MSPSQFSFFQFIGSVFGLGTVRLFKLWIKLRIKLTKSTLRVRFIKCITNNLTTSLVSFVDLELFSYNSLKRFRSY